MKTRTKVALTALCALLLVAVSIAGTLAYLTSKTDSIVNTFTFGNVNITLTETDATGDTDKTKTFALVPGESYSKDPVVKVAGGSEDCYVFVKVEEAIAAGKTFSDYITYSVNAGEGKTWTKLDNVDNVYYLKYTEKEDEQPYYVLTGNTTNMTGVVTCPNSLTSEMITGLNGSNPTLTFTAYAIQDEGFNDAAAAWTALNSQLNA